MLQAPPPHGRPLFPSLPRYCVLCCVSVLCLSLIFLHGMPDLSAEQTIGRRIW